MPGRMMMRRDSEGPPRRRKDFKKREGTFFRKKVCRFCGDKQKDIDYKNVLRLQKFLTEKGKIIPSRISGNCAKHQRRLARSIKRARAIALLPYVAE
ncbi:MAG: 30S ribosomal protein S18 [Candidatus Omnitrophica bacterium]|nr:30S ribosomal protein S18 [Candidatus Omnitrophota bacterium]MBU4488233.1 30S ribosomal protein S18 [Candidatus Omnitrophota bacterium]MCG2704681.1 30S ribosomal protein S18 [Candidatus Omnitrophota bacterium]